MLNGRGRSRARFDQDDRVICRSPRPCIRRRKGRWRTCRGTHRLMSAGRRRSRTAGRCMCSHRCTCCRPCRHSRCRSRMNRCSHTRPRTCSLRCSADQPCMCSCRRRCSHRCTSMSQWHWSARKPQAGRSPRARVLQPLSVSSSPSAPPEFCRVFRLSIRQ